LHSTGGTILPGYYTPDEPKNITYHTDFDVVTRAKTKKMFCDDDRKLLEAGRKHREL
jgi:hypothetical protein